MSQAATHEPLAWLAKIVSCIQPRATSRRRSRTRPGARAQADGLEGTAFILSDRHTSAREATSLLSLEALLVQPLVPGSAILRVVGARGHSEEHQGPEQKHRRFHATPIRVHARAHRRGATHERIGVGLLSRKTSEPPQTVRASDSLRGRLRPARTGARLVRAKCHAAIRGDGVIDRRASRSPRLAECHEVPA
jgi:hypothetical protein